MTIPIIPALLLLQASGLSSFAPLLLQVAAIFAIFYFLMIRPQQQQRRTHETALAAIKRGDQIVTAGGIVGEVIHVKETVTAEGD
ncbi:MAG: preprotein translocase subunit YajC, partial [Gemmatimonadaceae bacterium]|nr:preprotein translocase subunit YajC [Gemmatimonadaceae bacterium]